jgi:hypothetical protein
MAIEIKGFFLPDSTGPWTFWQYATACNSASDDSVTFYIGNSALSPTSSNFNSYVNWITPQTSFTVYLIAGQYYPVVLYYSQGDAGYILGFGYTAPDGSSIAYDGTNHFFNQNDGANSFSATSQNNQSTLSSLVNTIIISTNTNIFRHSNMFHF